jgi:hypothetical protein
MKGNENHSVLFWRNNLAVIISDVLKRSINLVQTAFYIEKKNENKAQPRSSISSVLRVETVFDQYTKHAADKNDSLFASPLPQLQIGR